MKDNFPILYHYCPPEAFFSIINSGELWLSNIAFTNDPLDGRLVTKSMKDLYSYSNKDFISNCFISSFSTDSDSLVQWLAYASRARGFAIGFNFSSLIDENGLFVEECLPCIPNTSYEFRKVIYTDKQTVRTHFKEFIDEEKRKYYAQYLERKKKGAFDSAKDISITEEDYVNFGVHKFITWCDKFFKNKYFEHEKEYRLVINYTESRYGINRKSIPSEYDYKCVDGKIIPIVKLNFLNLKLKNNSTIKDSVVRKIILGPANPNSCDVISDFVNRKPDYFMVSVIKSDIPFK